MKKWKRIRLGLLGGLFALLIGVWFLPFPIEGNWEYPPARIYECYINYHAFLRFEKGKILEMSNAHFPPKWKGTYKRTGWGKYEIEEFGISPYVVHTTLLFMNSPEDPFGFSSDADALRDLSILTCREIVNNPSNDWMAFIVETWLHVTGTPEKRMFRDWHGEQTKEQLEARLDYLFKQPLQIYTATNDVPSFVIELLEELGVDYTIRANQEWIVSGPLSANPAWGAIKNKTLYGLIITSPSGGKRYGDARDKNDYQIYFTNDGLMSFEHLGGIIDSHRRRGDDWKKNLRLYVKDGILPEDVRQLFAQFDLEYTVLDEKVLYRGKSKDPYAKKGDTP